MLEREKLVELFADLPVLETDRLFLRALRTSDAADLFDYAHREDVTKFLLWKPHKTIEHTTEYLRYIQERYRAGLFYDWALELKDTGKMIGTCGFTSFDPANGIGEIGYVLNPDYRGHSLALEAAQTVVRFGFQRLDLHRIEVRIMKGNEASFRVAEKLKMQFEGWKRDAALVAGTYRTVGICSILKEECPYLV